LLEVFYNPIVEVLLLFSYFYVSIFSRLYRIFLQNSIIDGKIRLLCSVRRDFWQR